MIVAGWPPVPTEAVSGPSNVSLDAMSRSTSEQASSALNTSSGGSASTSRMTGGVLPQNSSRSNRSSMPTRKPSHHPSRLSPGRPVLTTCHHHRLPTKPSCGDDSAVMLVPPPLRSLPQTTRAPPVRRSWTRLHRTSRHPSSIPYPRLPSLSHSHRPCRHYRHSPVGLHLAIERSLRHHLRSPRRQPYPQPRPMTPRTASQLAPGSAYTTTC